MTMNTCSLQTFELSCKPIPYSEIIRLFEYLPAGHRLRWPLMVLFLTGCRPSELERMRVSGHDSFLKSNYLFWRVGKNQKGVWRREWLPDYALKEYEAYKASNRARNDFITGVRSETLARYFNRDIRPLLGGRWLEKVVTIRKNGVHEYVLQLKSFRKSFLCLIFYEQFIKWKSSEVALQRTAARARHSSSHITSNFYLRDLEALEMDKYGGLSHAQILGKAVCQTKIDDYVKNNQSFIQEYY